MRHRCRSLPARCLPRRDNVLAPQGHRAQTCAWLLVLFSDNYHRVIFTGAGSHLERWAACVVPASVPICTLVRVHAPSSQREKAISPVHTWWNIASHASQRSYIFNFCLRREMSGQGLEFIKPGNQLRDVMSPFGVRSGPKPQRNQHLVSFLLPQRTLLT